MARRYNNYRYENPFNGMTPERDSIHSVPFWTGLLVIASLWGIFGIIYMVDGILPTGLTISDEELYLDSFISERAEQDLKYLTDLGPKITGSYENEYGVVDFLTKQVKSIISEAHPNQYIELDIQIVTGGYYLNDLAGYMNVYDKIQNVIVKLHGQHNESEHSILLNCHFDSVPISPGGSDDGINVAIMLEILRKLSKSITKQQHNVIFLFNGAEETPLQASHGFIAHHKWANESKILINLESSGAGGKLILFQTGPETPWLLKYYSKVPHPYGAVMAEEIFQSGLIPSDTDFRVFRDFGNMVGVDMAYFRDGYRYHTKYDGFSNIPIGSYQHGGDNTLSLVKSLSNAPEILEQERSTGKSVYFDFFGLFMVTYSNRMAIILNFVTIILSVAVFGASVFDFRIGIKKTSKYSLWTLLLITLSWIVASLTVVGIAFLLDTLNKTMSWYGRPWFVFGLYIVPVVALSGCLMHFSDHKNLALGVRCQLQAHLLRIMWTLVLIFLTLLNIRSAYFITILVLFDSVGFLIIHLFRLQHTVRAWQIVYITSLILPVLYTLCQAWIALICFIPITGRTGSDLNPELYIGAICLVFTLIIVSPLTVLSNLMRRAIWYYLTLLGIFALFLGLLYSPLGFPYSGNENSPTPQRHWIMHTQRQFFNESFEETRSDSGFLMVNMDRNSPGVLKPYVKQLGNVASVAEDCEIYTFCGVPLSHAKVIKKIEASTWIPTSPPLFPENETLKVTLTSKQHLTSTQIKYTIEVKGPDKLVFYVTPRKNTTFISTSLIDTVKPTKFNFQGRPVYVILYQLGKGDGTPLTFDFTMEIASTDHVGPTVDLAVSGRYVHESRIRKSTEYLEFLGSFPEWAHPIPWVAAYQSYVL